MRSGNGGSTLRGLRCELRSRLRAARLAVVATLAAWASSLIARSTTSRRSTAGSCCDSCRALAGLTPRSLSSSKHAQGEQ
jgi:hypothetical protein